ncbi:MFS transporter [Altererythrobacter indicus]|uniref:MFS transporter n=1 Tax=Altericroceibacterium indicum TaxID=374177 RepID=A0A845A552_9SPHN|nr:MFS transporter [Altericroceibacterium indicum]MXP24687.1 MFS transporter [Altericroceibacterium indicum]
MPAQTRGGEWRRNWPLVILTALALTSSPATLPVYSIGVLTGPLEAEFGWSRATIQAAITFSTGLGFFGGPLGGWLVERFGVRRSILGGIVGLGGAVLVCAAMTGSAWQLYLLYAAMALLGAGAGAVSWTFLIADRFVRSRGLALGVALSGTGLAAFITPRIAVAGLEWGGWQGAYIWLAGFCLLLILPLCLLGLPRGTGGHRAGSLPETELPRAGLTLGEAVRGHRFWLIGVATLCIYVAVGGLIPNLVPALTDSGLSQGEAVSIMGFFGLAIVAGRILVGFFVDIFWAPLVASAVLIPAAIACFLIQQPLDFVAYAMAAMAIGMATGMEFDMLGFLAARYLGLAHFARIYGRLYIFVALGAGLAPPAFAFAYDTFGNYGWPLTISAGLLLLGAGCFLALGRYPAERELALSAQ